MHMSGSAGCVWEAVLWKQRLYVQVPSDLVPDGSKQGFITMLEFAEEALECTHVIVCFKKDASQRAVFLRTFMFLGFQILAPGHPLVPTLPDSICMAYTIHFGSNTYRFRGKPYGLLSVWKWNALNIQDKRSHVC